MQKMFSYLLLMIGLLAGTMIGIVIGFRMKVKIKQEGSAIQPGGRKAKALDYDVFPMEGLKDE